ncbi:response regulator [Chamaesiphon sp. OTE_8_metabat_110]|uniref:response regulator n=1 Tax=Chamaesiphon sp. OTE_8_metabat_110 TaxID=2964696 RepID=UPI00286A72B5|nr:response regulator [Chamaesiphon sp. OTE_8_metabat_110]
MKILVVEDDPVVAEALKITLGDLNYAVEVAEDGQAGWEFVEAFDYDLLLLDAVLPKLDGVSLCRQIRSRGYVMPILLLTSKDSRQDRAIGLDAGADDYVVKPFDCEELSARIRALLRRGNDRMQPVLTWNQLTLDPRNYEVIYQDRLLNLTPKEYALLELFLRYRRRLFSCGAILEHLWTFEDTPSEEAVRTHIKGLRHKLKAAGAPADFIETVYGTGYRLKWGDLDTPIPAPQQHQLSTEDVRGSDDRHDVVAPAVVSQPPPVVNDSLQFLTEIWNRHHARMLDRVAAIERVVIASADGVLDAEILREAWNCAHTLAGALGTFGLMLGSQVAKEIELLLKENPELTPAQIALVQSGVIQLRQEIASKVPATEPPPLSLAPTPAPWLLAIATDRDLISALQSTPSNFETIVATDLIPSQLDRSPQAIILDLDCFSPIADGLSALSELERDYPQIPVIVLSRSHPHSIAPSQREMSAIRHRTPSAAISQHARLNPLAETAIVSAEQSIEVAPEDTQQLHHRIEVARRGARLFLTKPLLAAQIFGAVDRLHQARTTQVRVTIVDDDPLLLEGVSALLARRGTIVTTLSEPSRFWEVLEASAPDLLILDLDMPTYDGIELCRAVRTDPAWETLPILFLTSHTATIASDLVFAAGADDFVAKSAIESTLVTRIVNRLKRSGIYRH